MLERATELEKKVQAVQAFVKTPAFLELPTEFCYAIAAGTGYWADRAKELRRYVSEPSYGVMCQNCGSVAGVQDTEESFWKCGECQHMWPKKVE